MRNKNHHLIQRNETWYIRYDIPKEIRHNFPKMKSPTQMESLRVKDVKTARKKRDDKLGALEKLWDKQRQENDLRKYTGVTSDVFSSYREWAYEALRSEQATQIENIKILLDEKFDQHQYKNFKPHDQSQEAYLESQEEARNSPLGRELVVAGRILSGNYTPIKMIADEWLLTKPKLGSSTLYRYKKAIKILTDKYEFIEEIEFRDARNFMATLLQTLNKRTVIGYCGAYRGIWGHLGKHRDMWSTKELSSLVESVKVERWSDEEYLHLLEECTKRGHRDLWLAIRIAAYTGGAVQGVARLEVRDEGNARSLFLNETKRENRPRLIPCHPAIHKDVIEWQKYSHTPKSLSKKFTEFKQSLGYPKLVKVFHSFRHACVNKLENARVSDREIQRLLGHKLGKMTFDTYNHEGLDYDVLSDIISKLKWPEV